MVLLFGMALPSLGCSLGGRRINAKKMALPQRLVQAIETGDRQALESLFSADAVVWHNHDRLQTKSSQWVDGATGLAVTTDGLRMELHRTVMQPDGFAIQFVLRGTFKDSGQPWSMHNSMFIRTENGKIRRLDEYVDLSEFGTTPPSERQPS